MKVKCINYSVPNVRSQSIAWLGLLNSLFLRSNGFLSIVEHQINILHHNHAFTCTNLRCIFGSRTISFLVATVQKRVKTLTLIFALNVAEPRKTTSLFERCMKALQWSTFSPRDGLHNLKSLVEYEKCLIYLLVDLFFLN